MPTAAGLIALTRRSDNSTSQRAARPGAPHRFVNESAVCAVELLIGFIGRRDVEPHHLARVVARGERHLVAHLFGAVEVEGCRLNPCVICNARIVNVAAVHLSRRPARVGEG